MAQLNYLKVNNDNKNLQHKVNGQNKGIDNRLQGRVMGTQITMTCQEKMYERE